MQGDRRNAKMGIVILAYHELVGVLADHAGHAAAGPKAVVQRRAPDAVLLAELATLLGVVAQVGVAQAAQDAVDEAARLAALAYVKTRFDGANFAFLPAKL